jgi:hypothetical protein
MFGCQPAEGGIPGRSRSDGKIRRFMRVALQVRAGAFLA